MRNLIPIALLLVSAGCARPLLPQQDAVRTEGLYQTFEHDNSDAAFARIQKAADQNCAIKKGYYNPRETYPVAVRTGGTCSLNQCTTHYQCMTKGDAARVAPPPAKK